MPTSEVVTYKVILFLYWKVKRKTVDKPSKFWQVKPKSLTSNSDSKISQLFYHFKKCFILSYAENVQAF